jgi:hypothetical protein
MERQIHETKEYSIFKKVKQNRIIDMKHVVKLAESIKEKDKRIDFPIIINNNMEIIEGQHRFEACKLLNLSVYYIFAISMSIDDISRINTINKKWTMEDYLHQYSENGNENYIKLKNFIYTSNCKTVSKALRLLSNTKKYNDRSGLMNSEAIHRFRIGEYKYPENDSFVSRKIYELTQISEYTYQKNPFNETLLAVYDILISHDYYDFDRLISKLKQKKLNVFSDTKSGIDAINDVYNYNVKQNQSINHFHVLKGRQ